MAPDPSPLRVKPVGREDALSTEAMTLATRINAHAPLALATLHFVALISLSPARRRKTRSTTAPEVAAPSPSDWLSACLASDARSDLCLKEPSAVPIAAIALAIKRSAPTSSPRNAALKRTESSSAMATAKAQTRWSSMRLYRLQVP